MRNLKKKDEEIKPKVSRRKEIIKVKAEIHDIKKQNKLGAYLVVQWITICLPMQGTQIQPLSQEDPTCPGTTKPAAAAAASL